MLEMVIQYLLFWIVFVVIGVIMASRKSKVSMLLQHTPSHSSSDRFLTTPDVGAPK